MKTARYFDAAQAVGGQGDHGGVAEPVAVGAREVFAARLAQGGVVGGCRFS